MKEGCKWLAFRVICIERTCCRRQKDWGTCTIRNQFVAKLATSKNKHYSAKYDISNAWHRLRYQDFSIFSQDNWAAAYGRNRPERTCPHLTPVSDESELPHATD